MVITRIEPLPCAKVAGVLYAMIGFIVGAIASVAILAGGISASSFPAPGMGGLVGIGAIVILPIFYGVMGFVMGYVVPWLYNLVAGWVGGIEIQTK